MTPGLFCCPVYADTGAISASDRCLVRPRDDRRRHPSWRVGQEESLLPPPARAIFRGSPHHTLVHTACNCAAASLSSSGSTSLRNLRSALNRRTAPIHSPSEARGSAGHEPPRQLRPSGKISEIFDVLAGPSVASSNVRLNKKSRGVPETIYGSLERRVHAIFILSAYHVAYALNLVVVFHRAGVRGTPRWPIGG